MGAVLGAVFPLFNKRKERKGISKNSYNMLYISIFTCSFEEISGNERKGKIGSLPTSHFFLITADEIRLLKQFTLIIYKYLLVELLSVVVNAYYQVIVFNSRY